MPLREVSVLSPSFLAQFATPDHAPPVYAAMHVRLSAAQAPAPSLASWTLPPALLADLEH
jgi:hypothetical protein